MMKLDKCSNHHCIALVNMKNFCIKNLLVKGAAASLMLAAFHSNPAYAQSAPVENCLTNHPANDRYASYSPDGEHIVFESDRTGNWDIFLMKNNGKNVQQITHDTSAERQPAWHPTGKKILFESTRDGANRFFLYDLDSQKAEKMEIPGLPDGDWLFGRISPDGRHLAFSVKFSDTVFHIFLLEITSQKWRQLTSENFRHTYPTWSPDGKSLSFHARHDTNNRDDEIYTMRLNTGKMRRLTTEPKHNFCPAWSPDGKNIAYVFSMENRNTEIFLMRKNGKKKQRLTHNNFGDALPSWHPWEKKLLISAWRNDNYEICELQLR